MTITLIQELFDYKSCKSIKKGYKLSISYFHVGPVPMESVPGLFNGTDILKSVRVLLLEDYIILLGKKK